jgi:predicted  nucleic acid-binding Zn-ribbon protein
MTGLRSGTRWNRGLGAVAVLVTAAALGGSSVASALDASGGFQSYKQNALAEAGKLQVDLTAISDDLSNARASLQAALDAQKENNAGLNIADMLKLQAELNKLEMSVDTFETTSRSLRGTLRSLQHLLESSYARQGNGTLDYEASQLASDASPLLNDSHKLGSSLARLTTPASLKTESDRPRDSVQQQLFVFQHFYKAAANMLSKIDSLLVKLNQQAPKR